MTDGRTVSDWTGQYAAGSFLSRNRQNNDPWKVKRKPGCATSCLQALRPHALQQNQDLLPQSLLSQAQHQGPASCLMVGGNSQANPNGKSQGRKMMQRKNALWQEESSDAKTGWPTSTGLSTQSEPCQAPTSPMFLHNAPDKSKETQAPNPKPALEDMHIQRNQKLHGDVSDKKHIEFVPTWRIRSLCRGERMPEWITML